MLRPIRILHSSFSAPCRHFAQASSESIAALPTTQISTLPNGMRVASEHLDLETATIGVWIDAGSRFETEKTNGSAHFLEHMAFKVIHRNNRNCIRRFCRYCRCHLTWVKGTGKRSKTALEMEIENMGGHLNAYTSREQTAYFAKVFKKDVPAAVDILSDILTNSKLDPKDIEAERGVILRESDEIEANMQELIFDHLHSVAYQGTALGRTILGTRSNINSLQRSDLTSFVKRNYIGPRMVLAAAGGVDHSQLCKLASSAFANIPATGAMLKPESALFTGSEVRYFDTDADNAHIVLSVEGCSWTSPDYFPLLVAQSIVGNWDRALASGSNMTSKLAQVVSQNSLAHSFMSFNTCYSDTGLWGIYLVSDRKYALDDLVFEVQKEWMRLCMDITDGEVARAKQQLKATTLLYLDGTTSICEDIGRQVLAYGKRYSLSEIHDMIDAVDTSQVKAAARKYVYDKCPAVAAMGSIATLPDYNRIRAANLLLRN